MVNQRDSLYWRAVDLGHASIRWRDDVFTVRDLDEHSTPYDSGLDARLFDLEIGADDDFEQRSMEIPTMLTLCELELDQYEKRLRLSSKAQPHHAPRTFPQWRQIEQLCASKSLGVLESVTQQDKHLWIKSPQGEFTPRALLAQSLAQHLTPDAVIGERSYHTPINGLLWLRDLGHSPLLTSMIYRSLTELPFPSGGSLGLSIATLMGVVPPQRLHNNLGLWGVLDIGEGSASWSLIELSASSVMNRIIFKELASYGQNWVGEQALSRALLSDHLEQKHQMWSELSAQERSAWVSYTHEQTRAFMRASWPSYLPYPDPSPSTFDMNELSGSSLEVFKRFQYGTYLGVLAWIEHSLTQHRIGPEALRGIWVTGRQGVTLISKLRRILSSVNIKVAPPHAALRGAHRFIRSTLAPHNSFCYQAEEVSMYALKLYDHHEEITQTLLREQERLPTVAQVMVGPTSGSLSLVLSAYGAPSVTIAEHPPIDERRLLRVYYEGPHLFEVEWVDLSPQASTVPYSGSQVQAPLNHLKAESRSEWRLI